MKQTKRPTVAQTEQFVKLANDVLRSTVPRLTAAGAQFALTALQAREFQDNMRRLVLEATREYFVFVTDEEAVHWLREYKRWREAEATNFVSTVRRVARAEGVEKEKHSAIAQPGATIRGTFPRMISCQFGPLHTDQFSDPPSQHALVVWIPKLCATPERAEIKQKVRGRPLLGAHADNQNIIYVAGMMLAHFLTTGEVPVGKDNPRWSPALTGTECGTNYRMIVRLVEGKIFFDDMQMSDYPPYVDALYGGFPMWVLTDNRSRR